ncbi:MAG TPA: hypothetical protein VH369_08450 [Bryobacteraceae bacterium]
MLVLFTILLQTVERGGFLFTAAHQAGFLKLQIAQLFFVDQMGVQLDQAAANGGVVLILKHIGELDSALGIDSHFEGGDAAQAPGDIGERLDEFGFFETNGLPFLFVGGDVALVFGSVVGGKQDGGAGEAGFDGIQRRVTLTRFGAGSGAEKCIGAIGGEPGGGDFGSCFRLGLFGRELLLLAGGFAGELAGFALSGATDGTWCQSGLLGK